MTNNNEITNFKVPEEIKTAIDTYKNQATAMGLEVNRLQTFKAQIESEISKLTAREAEKKESVEAIQKQIDKSRDLLSGLETKKDELIKEEKETMKRISDAKKEIADRDEALRIAERKVKLDGLALDERKKEIAALAIETEQSFKEFKEKKELIAEFAKKL
jgi:chromosome segregation ATPase